MLKICPKCKEYFECSINDISKCQCFNITINADDLALIKQDFDDCLCGECLKKVAIKTHNQP
ncbi:MAG: cysteine-rich CWC family protein [Chitinophagaceae bacterium]